MIVLILMFSIISDPPPHKPSITTTNNLLGGDNYTANCTVNGGKPLVSSITMECASRWTQARNFVVHETSASNSLTWTVVPSDDRKYCKCRAVWSPRPYLYSYGKTANHYLNTYCK